MQLVCVSRTVIDELNKEMLSVKECYVTVCRERDEQEATLKAEFEEKQQLKEEKVEAEIILRKKYSRDGDCIATIPDLVPEQRQILSAICVK